MELVSIIIYSLIVQNLSKASAILLKTIQEKDTRNGGFTYQSYQRSITCTAESPPLEPRTLSNIQNIINRAIKSNTTVKVVGNLHSATDCICTEGIVINMTNINHFSYDPDTKRATVGAGMDLGEFMDRLHDHGRAIHGAPLYHSVTMGGVTATGAHGSSLNYPSTLSDQIFSVTIVDGRGILRKINETENDFKAFRVHLGLLGVIYEVVVNTIEQYKLQIRHIPLKDEILWVKQDQRSILDMATSHDVFQFWWFPTNKAVVLSIGDRFPIEERGNCEVHQIPEVGKVESTSSSIAIEVMQAARDHFGFFLLQSFSMLGTFKTVPVRTPYYTKANGITPCLPEATGFSHRMLSNGCYECPWNQGELSLLQDDASVAIPISEYYPALKTLQEIFDSQLTSFPLNGLYFRFLPSSDSYVAINSEKAVVIIEWITNPRYDKSQPKLGIAAFQAIGQALIKKHQGRPHWAKNGLLYQHPDVLYRVHPQLNKFVRAMEKYDPKGVFMNDFGTRIRFRKNQMTLGPEMLEHCGLTEACVCKNDVDCGDLQCGDLLGNRVCRQGIVDDLKDTLSRGILKGITTAVQNEEFVLNALNGYNVFGELFKGKRKNAESKRLHKLYHNMTSLTNKLYSERT